MPRSAPRWYRRFAAVEWDKDVPTLDEVLRVAATFRVSNTELVARQSVRGVRCACGRPFPCLGTAYFRGETSYDVQHISAC
eukprot:363998-Chlamydomonas_euryale.AAC.5